MGESLISYTDWKIEHTQFLDQLNTKKVYVLFSAGKDSSLALDFILRASKEFKFGFETHAGAFPVHRYTEVEKERIGSYWCKRGVEIIWHQFVETDEQIKCSENPCHSCQRIRKELLKTVISREDRLEDIVLIVSFSLWDIVGYSLEHILGNIFPGPNGKDDSFANNRFTETAQRYYVILKMDDGYTIFRPLIKFNGSDILATLNDLDIPILSIPCDFRDYRPKRILEKYYEKMGLRFDYDSVFNFAKNELDLPDKSSFTSIKKDKYLREIF